MGSAELSSGSKLGEKARKGQNSSNSSCKNDSSVSLNSNLTIDEVEGLKSLRKKISDGSLIVCETDKSKRFAIMTRQQYLEAGFVHTKNDIEIEPHMVKKFQKCVNDHVWWARDIFNIGDNWGHSDRMTNNLMDKGEQTCQMTLLCKDHKDWTPDSDKPPLHAQWSQEM